MLSPDHLNVLRERNRTLLEALQKQRQKLETVNSGLQSRKRLREDGPGERSEAREEVTVTAGDRGSARAALAAPTVTFTEPIKYPDDPERSTRPRPLLGYDWIAGVIDAEDSLLERSDDFFNDLCTFRALNKDQCVNSTLGFPEEASSSMPSRSEEDISTALKDTHKCTFSYRINSRLFPVPLDSQERCPVCKKDKSDHPHTAREPAHIRVSIPRSTILPPYKHKAHRRCSFDPSDSLGLPSHCLSGWSNKVQNTFATQSHVDLRGSLDTKKEAEKKELEDLPVFKISRRRPQQIPRVSRLTRHDFQHFSPRKKMSS